jgi:uncharacterized membrane protein
MRWLALARTAGGKAGADPPSVHRDPRRLVAFSDAVFAITITLLVLAIRPPADYSNLLHGLVALWPSYLAYAVTFLFIGQVWANHHVMFDHIRAADRIVLLLNTLLLMVVAFLPFATSVLAGALRNGHGQRTAVVFYGIAFWVTALTFNAVWQYACRQRLLSEALDTAGATAIGRRFQLALAWLATGGPAWRRATRPGRGRDRRVQRLLLAPDPRRESPSATLLRRAHGSMSPTRCPRSCLPEPSRSEPNALRRHLRNSHGPVFSRQTETFARTFARLR